MKVILYIVALLTIVAAAYFTRENIQLHQEQIELTNNLESDNEILRADIAKLEKDFKDQQQARKKEKSIKFEFEGNIEQQKLDLKDYIAESASFDNELESLVAKKEEIDTVIAGIKTVVQKENIPLEDVAGYFEQMADEKKQLNKQHGDLLEEVERFNGIVEKNKGTLADFQKQRIARRKRLKANGVSSLITAVDGNWGIVVIKPNTNANITENSKLIVIRGDQHIGRLTINAIEKNRILADIDYKSLVPGLRIRPGDRVILSKPVTN